jgi:hypothetical protein
MLDSQRRSLHAPEAAGILLFASDGGGNYFGFDTVARPSTYVELPAIGMDRRYMDVRGTSLLEFLEYLAQASQ